MDRSNSGSKRIEYIDRLKGFAIVLVVLGHVTDGYFFGRFDPGSDDIFWTICNIIYSFHMPLMMMISGYLFSAAYLYRGEEKSLLIKWKRAAVHLLNMLFVYIVFSLMYGFLKMKMSGVVTDVVTVDDLKGIFVKSISPFWYLYVLIVFSFVTPLLVRLFGMLRLPQVYMVTAIGLGLNIFANVKLNININRFELYRLCYFFFFFSGGMLIRLLLDSRKNSGISPDTVEAEAEKSVMKKTDSVSENTGEAETKKSVMKKTDSVSENKFEADAEKSVMKKTDSASENIGEADAERTSKTGMAAAAISALCLAGGAVLLYITWDNVQKIYMYTIPFFNTVTALLLSLSVWLIAEYIIPEGTSRLFRMLGNYTLEIYVLHVLFTSLIRHIFNRLNYREPFSCIIINLILSLAASMLTVFIMDKIRLRDILFKPFKRIGK